MNWRGHLVAAAVLTTVGLLALGTSIFATRGSVREHLRDEYTLVSQTNGGRSAEFRSDRKASDVARSIASKWRPSERHSDPGGYFLRYRGDIVAVTPEPDGSGSRIHLDDDQRGYARWYPYVGGYWGTFSGPGESFRGGGPGAGK